MAFAEWYANKMRVAVEEVKPFIRSVVVFGPNAKFMKELPPNVLNGGLASYINYEAGRGVGETYQQQREGREITAHSSH